MTTEIQTQPRKDLIGWLAAPATLEEFRKALPAVMTAERWTRSLQTTARKNPKLLQCSLASVQACIMTAAQLGLEPNVQGLCYLIPRGNECTLIIGYEGMLALMRRSGEIRSFSANIVRKSDTFKIARHLEVPFIHEENHDPDADDSMVGVYCFVRLKSGENFIEYMSKKQCDQIRARSQSGSSGPWKTDYEQMCRKTVIRRAFHYLPKSTDIVQALELLDDEERVPGQTIDATHAPLETVKRGALRIPMAPPAADEEVEKVSIDVDATDADDNELPL
jgi:recombination protein RecT